MRATDFELYLGRVRSILRSVWAEFNLFQMAIGLSLSLAISLVVGLRCLDLFHFALAAMLAAFSTSNSFIIMEDQISLFLAQFITCTSGAISNPGYQFPLSIFHFPNFQFPFSEL